MESTFPTRGIILNRRDWREADRLVSVYTPEHGRLNLLARGARKQGSKLAAHLEPITLSNFLVVKGKGYDYVGAAVIEEPYLGIKQDLNKLYFAGQAFMMFNRLVREAQPDPELFAWLEKWLCNLDAAGEKLDKQDGRFRLALFNWRLLALLGFGPRLDKCVSCEGILSAGRNRFDVSLGGLICDACVSKPRQEVVNGSLIPVSDNIIKLLRLVDGNGVKNMKFSPRLLKEWENLNLRLLNWNES